MPPAERGLAHGFTPPAETNPIDNLIGSVRKVSRRVKRWRGGRIMLRWWVLQCWMPSSASAVSGATERSETDRCPQSTRCRT